MIVYIRHVQDVIIIKHPVADGNIITVIDYKIIKLVFLFICIYMVSDFTKYF